jgi:hypothetical protein
LCNKDFYDESKQKDFLVKWCEELQAYLKETKEYQVECFLSENKLNINNSSLQYTRDWIHTAK